MTETHVFMRGRWKVISERGLVRLLLFGIAVSWIGGFVLGFETCSIAFEKRIAAVEAELVVIKSEVQEALRARGM